MPTGCGLNRSKYIFELSCDQLRLETGPWGPIVGQHRPVAGSGIRQGHLRQAVHHGLKSDQTVVWGHPRPKGDSRTG